MDSIWEKDVQMPWFPQLTEDLQADVLIIGGGLAGLLCAWKLTKAGVDCVLIEENQLMCGTSGRTTAKITSQHGRIYSKLLDTLGTEKARLYWQANTDALAAFRELAQKIDCDFQIQSSYLFTEREIDKLDQEMAAYERLKIPYRWRDTLPLPFPVTGALEFTEQAQFHPLKLAAGIAGDLKIFEKTKALEFMKNGVRTPRGKIRAEKIIVATHFPMLNKHGGYFLKLYQQRSYVIALEDGEQVDGMYLDCRENGLSVRNAGPWILLGGGGHRTGKQGAGWQLPETVAKKYYPKAKETARWATQDCMTLDGMPYVGQYSLATPNLYVATGFQKWGMTGSMAAAGVLKDLVMGKENPYTDLLSPSRSILHKQLLSNSVEATVNLLRPTVPRCPHLGCALHWNAREHSWDCACHGSRFDEKGKRLNGPATGDMKKAPPERL